MKRRCRLLCLLACLLTASFVLVGCGDDSDGDDGDVDPTTGSLELIVSPTAATVNVSGPNNFNFNDAGQTTYTLEALEPGIYTVAVSAPGFLDQQSTTNVVAGDTTRLTFNLIAATERQAFYIDANGQLVEIPASALDSTGNFVFFTWLQDRAGGITTNPIDPTAGAPSEAEQREIAPSFTQNLAAAFVGIRIEENIFPVVNAAVRWEIDRQFDGALNSLQFGAADDGSNAPGAHPAAVIPRNITDDQADTFTNNGNVRNPSRFPVAENSPLYNLTGVSTPDTNGFTWVTLFSPDDRARARIVVVASVNDTEIGKDSLIKSFAPQPLLAITKTVDPLIVILPQGENARVTFTMTVRNDGNGDADNVVLSDLLTDGPPRGYNIAVNTLPEGSEPVDQDEDGNFEGFNLTIAALPAGASQTLTFEAIVNREAPQYCNTMRILSFDNELETVTVDIPAEACFNVIGPRLEIIKDFVDAQGNTLGETVTVGADEVARVRVRLINSGTADALEVILTDALTEVSDGGTDEAYSISSLPANATPDGNSGFELNLGTIPAGETVTLDFNAQASQDGRYCDTASFATAAAGTGADEACLVVASPALTIVKSNVPTTNLFPLDSYESTITVTNGGNAAASNVIISDRIGLLNDTTDGFVEFVSSNQDGTAGTFNGTDTVTFASVPLAPDASVTVTVTSLIPANALPGVYCDIARYTSADAGSAEVEACVTVAAFSSIQASLNDAADPVRSGGLPLEFNGTIFNEVRSNERVINNAIEFSFGGGQFAIQSTELFLDRDPILDPNTGLVISGPEQADRELTLGTDYTISADGTGEETITLDSSVTLGPGQAIYTRHRVTVPAVTQAEQFTSSYTWTAAGQISGLSHSTTQAESTTVIP